VLRVPVQTRIILLKDILMKSHKSAFNMPHLQIMINEQNPTFAAILLVQTHTIIYYMRARLMSHNLAIAFSS
jgi:hypothetical protein